MFERAVNSTCDGLIMIPDNLNGLTTELKWSGRNGIGRSTEIPILKAGQAMEFTWPSAKWKWRVWDGEVSLPHTSPLPHLQHPLQDAPLSGSRVGERMNVLWYPWGQGKRASTLLCPKTPWGSCLTLTFPEPLSRPVLRVRATVAMGWGCSGVVSWDWDPISGGGGDSGRRPIGKWGYRLCMYSIVLWT